MRAAGWSVFPCSPGEKVPFARKLPRKDPELPHSRANPNTFLAFVDEPPSVEQITEWWTPPRRIVAPPNLAVITGASGLLVVDVDAHKVSPERLAEVQARLPATPLIATTPSGGLHYYYRGLPAPLRAVTQKAHAFADCVDVQSGNLYVLAPPSVVGADPYRWRAGGPGLALPPAPPWVIADEHDRSSVRVFSGNWQTLAWSRDVPENGDPEGGIPGRKQHVRSLALADARANVPIDVALERLAAWNQLRAQPPLSGVEVSNLVHVMYRHHDRDIGAADDSTITLRVTSPPFPHGLLKVAPQLYSWAAYTSGLAGVHADLTCFTALIAAGMATVGKYSLEIEGIPVTSWSPPTLLWGVAVAPSGSKKSAVISCVAKALRPTQEALAIIARRFNAKLDARKAELAVAMADAKKGLSSPDPERREQASEIMNDVSLQLEELPERLPTVWIAADMTPEAMMGLLSQLGHIGLLSDEGEDTLGGFFGRYGSGPNMNGLLKAHDRGSTTSLRVGRGVTEVHEAEAAMLLTTQPSGLSGLVSHDAEDRGLTARILWAVIDTARPVILDPPTRDPDDRLKADNAFADVLRSIYFGGRKEADLALAAAQDYRPEYEEAPAFDLSELDALDEDDAPSARGRGRPAKPLIAPTRRKLLRPVIREPVRLLVSLAAQEHGNRLHRELAEGARLGGDHYLSRAWANKGREAAYRIAAVLALAASYGEARKVGPEFVEVACELVRKYFLPQVSAAADLMSWPAEAINAIHLLARFAERDTFTTADVARELSISTARAEALIAWLAERGALVVEKTRGSRALTCRRVANVAY